MRAAEQWKLGLKAQSGQDSTLADRGALIVVSRDDHRMRIEIGRGLEGDIPDALAGRVTDTILRPAFRAGAYERGLLQASRFLRDKAAHDPKAVEQAQKMSRSESASFNTPGWLPKVLFLAFILLMIFSPTLRTFVLFNAIFGGGRGGGGWGDRGGGGWSGGGGGFSGGGASSDW